MGHLRIRKYRDNRFKRIIVPRWNCHTEYSDEEKHHDFVLLRFPIVFLIATLLLFALLSNNTSAAEEYALHIFPVISVIISSIANLFPISLTEVAVVGLVFTAPILIAIAIYHLIYYIRQKLVKIFLVHWVLASHGLLSLVFCSSPCFTESIIIVNRFESVCRWEQMNTLWKN